MGREKTASGKASGHILAQVGKLQDHVLHAECQLPGGKQERSEGTQQAAPVPDPVHT